MNFTPFLNVNNIDPKGYCNTCDSYVKFNLPSSFWDMRSDYKCPNCESIPRERALMFVIELLFPAWEKLKIHESSPISRGASKKLKTSCKGYVSTQYFPEIQLGKIVKGYRNENLETQTFEDEIFDIVITQDVMEHIFNPRDAFSEIARTLKPGGAHIFTVPLINRDKKTERCAKITKNGEVSFLTPPVYHGNPVNDQGSLVTMNWGFDITSFIHSTSGLDTSIYYLDNLFLGIRAYHIEVFVSKKTKK